MLRTAHDLIAAAGRGIDLGTLHDEYAERQRDARRFTDAYRRYCWDVTSIDDVRLAPFHLLASEGEVHADRTHVWHMEQARRLAAHSPVLLATDYRVADLADEAACRSVEDWWLGLTREGGEGMVVKPLDFLPGGGRGRI